MKAVGEERLAAILQRERIGLDDSSYLGGGREDSDGVVYRIPGGRVLKIVDIPQDGEEQAVEAFRLRLEFASFLGERGMPVVHPLPLADGALYRVVEDGGRPLLYYLMQRVKGTPLRRKGMDRELRIRYGRMIGRAHRITGDFPGYLDRSLHLGYEALGWEREVDSFCRMCRDREVLARWRRIEGALHRLPRTRDSFGMIHNDPHTENVLLREDGSLVLLDIDVACFHFFAVDISVAAQEVLFGECGGIDRPMTNRSALEEFLRDFREGYEREHRLDRIFWDRIDLFIYYRSLLLYTVMQDWLETQEELREVWRNHILLADVEYSDRT